MEKVIHGGDTNRHWEQSFVIHKQDDFLAGQDFQLSEVLRGIDHGHPGDQPERVWRPKHHISGNRFHRDRKDQRKGN